LYIVTHLPESPIPRRGAIGVLVDYGFVINQQGFATVVPETGKKVYGVLWALSEGDLLHLDEYEDAAGGLYSRAPMKVTLRRGAVSNAFVYVAANDQPGSPRPQYVGAIVAAATPHGFPEPYIKELRPWLVEKQARGVRSPEP
jgi:gamma-glutamylcyclotransferase (GGCT)/AIG2-like uncharacterized protein YtfP